jgi:hypothetical protein
MAKRLAAIVALIGTSALAETPMTGAEFDAYATGKTLSFGTPGNPDFGVEQYLPGRDVIWSPAPDVCIKGVWFEQNGDICFLYDHDPEPKCWAVYPTENGIRAEFTNRPGTTVIFESRDDPKPLSCPGPDLLG